MIPLGYLVIKRLKETRKQHSLGLVEATSLTSLDEAEPEAEYSLDSAPHTDHLKVFCPSNNSETFC